MIGRTSYARSCWVAVRSDDIVRMYIANTLLDTNEDGDHIYMMFSATFPKGVRAIAREYMAKDYVRIHIGRIGSAHRNIRQDVIEVAQEAKRDAINDLLLSMTPCRTLIFCNSKMAVDLLDDFLYNRGFPTTSIHSGRDQRTREDAM